MSRGLATCPCCGYKTLEERGGYDICPVCWWEDDGQDNPSADETWGGPNRGSLTEARINFLREGIYNPARDDLKKQQERPDRFERGRTFVLAADGETVEEPATGWVGRAQAARSAVD